MLQTICNEYDCTMNDNSPSVAFPEFGNTAIYVSHLRQLFKNKGKDVLAELTAQTRAVIEMRKNNPLVNN